MDDTKLPQRLSRTYRISSPRGKPLGFILNLEPQAGGPPNVRSMQVCQVGGKEPRRIWKAGETYLEELHAGLYSFTSPHTQQLFVTGRLGAVHTHVYSIDSRTGQLRELYGRDGLRVVVTPKPGPGGLCFLEETWPRHQWPQQKNLGGATIHGNCVQRLLYWNGKAFVPACPSSL
jgi:hypothetical protein